MPHIAIRIVIQVPDDRVAKHRSNAATPVWYYNGPNLDLETPRQSVTIVGARSCLEGGSWKWRRHSTRKRQRTVTP
jgi:hypothetical protein